MLYLAHQLRNVGLVVSLGSLACAVTALIRNRRTNERMDRMNAYEARPCFGWNTLLGDDNRVDVNLRNEGDEARRVVVRTDPPLMVHYAKQVEVLPRTGEVGITIMAADGQQLPDSYLIIVSCADRYGNLVEERFPHGRNVRIPPRKEGITTHPTPPPNRPAAGGVAGPVKEPNRLFKADKTRVFPD